MYKVKFCIGKEIEILFSTIDFLVDHLPRYRRHTRYIFRGDLSKVGSFLSEAHPSFRESCSLDFLPRFLSARLLYRDLRATRIVVPLVARESFDAARHGGTNRIVAMENSTKLNFHPRAPSPETRRRVRSTHPRDVLSTTRRAREDSLRLP